MAVRIGAAFVAGKTPQALAKRMKGRGQRVASLNKSVGSIAATELEAELVKRDLMVRKGVNRQDAPAGRPLVLRKKRNSDVRTFEEPGVSGLRVRVKGFYTAARTKALLAIFASLGLMKTLDRRWLYIFRTGGVGVRARDKARRGDKPVKMLLSRFPRLAAWAQRLEKGLQARRHVVMLKGEALRRLVLQAVMLKKRGRILELWALYNRRGLRGFRG